MNGAAAGGDHEHKGQAMPANSNTLDKKTGIRTIVEWSSNDEGKKVKVRLPAALPAPPAALRAPGSSSAPRRPAAWRLGASLHA